jgi:hypothetical protein
MNNRYLEAIAVGIVTAIVAGFCGIGAQRTGIVLAPPAHSATPVAHVSQGGH